MTSALEVEALSVSFGATEVFRDLTFDVPEGSSPSIVGPNGSVIIPAATARRLARSLNGMPATAVVVAVLPTTLGTSAARSMGRPTGPLIITVAAGFFLLSLLRSQR